MDQLAKIFLQDAKGRADLPADEQELERLLEQTVDTARQGRRFTLEAKLFVAHLAQRLPPARAGVPLAQVLAETKCPDLYLASACLHQVPGAIEELERVHLSEFRTWLKRTDAVVDELCQTVLVQLLVGLTPAGPRLAKYQGRGSLQNWIHVVASHLLPPRNNPSPAGTLEDNFLGALEGIPAQGPSPETELDKRRIAQAFRQALSAAFAVLSAEQRRLLRFYYVDRLTTSELGKMMGMNQSTASRRLTEARETVYEETIRLLRGNLQLSSMELDSILIALGTSFDVSISRILGEPDEEKKSRPLHP